MQLFNSGVTQQMDSIIDKCLQELEDLKKLPHDWAKPDDCATINPDIISSAKSFVKSYKNYLLLKPMVVPMLSGNVQLEFHKSNNIDGDSSILELEFITPKKIHYLKDKENFYEKDVIDIHQEDKIIELFKWFNDTHKKKESLLQKKNIYSEPSFLCYGDSILSNYSLNTLEEEYFKRLKSSTKPTWHQYFMRLTHMVSIRSPDPSTKHGCVIVNQNNEVISMGYNGPPANLDDTKVPKSRPEKYPYFLHSEENALMYANQPLDGAKVYITGFPCSACVRKLIQKRVKSIYYGDVQSKCVDDKDRKVVIEMVRAYQGHLVLQHYPLEGFPKYEPILSNHYNSC